MRGTGVEPANIFVTES